MLLLIKLFKMFVLILLLVINIAFQEILLNDVIHRLSYLKHIKYYRNIFYQKSLIHII